MVCAFISRYVLCGCCAACHHTKAITISSGETIVRCSFCVVILDGWTDADGPRLGLIPMHGLTLLFRDTKLELGFTHNSRCCRRHRHRRRRRYCRPAIDNDQQWLAYKIHMDKLLSFGEHDGKAMPNSADSCLGIQQTPLVIVNVSRYMCVLCCAVLLQPKLSLLFWARSRSSIVPFPFANSLGICLGCVTIAGVTEHKTALLCVCGKCCTQ